MEGLDSTKTVSGIGDANEKSIEFVDVPDFQTRHRYLETALKLKKRLIDRKDITSDGKEIKGNTISLVPFDGSPTGQ
jgi:hypothetical protein